MAWKFWPEQGLWNPCRAGLLLSMQRSELVRSAFADLDLSQVWDSHAHLLGVGDSPSGIYLNPRMNSAMHPAEYVRRIAFLNAGCAYDLPGRSIDAAYVRRLLNVLDGMRRGCKMLLFAFERVYGDDGKPDMARTMLQVPDGYARELARGYPRYFEWACSIHPYRRDCAEALEQAKADGARAVKWLPAAMGIDPASPLCDRFYEAAARLKMPIITHAGLERAVTGADQQEYGNPLRLRRALDAGVRVVIAHCASMGEDRDTDQGEHGPFASSFELFSRLFEEKRYEKNLFGDISAMPQINRAAPALARVLEREDWHPRLLNGSDYPLPGLMPIFSVQYLVQLGLVQESALGLLKTIREYNPLLFDFVLKRHLRSNGKSFARSVFETRRFFEAA
ncbi:MAG TPA: amidohydrolase family protein [Burkholderiales bacterium]|nr:amidohydrolase family protein [Burkholderiales bacterium]